MEVANDNKTNPKIKKSSWSSKGVGCPLSKLNLLFTKEPIKSPVIAPKESKKIVIKL